MTGYINFTKIKFKDFSFKTTNWLKTMRKKKDEEHERSPAIRQMTSINMCVS